MDRVARVAPPHLVTGKTRTDQPHCFAGQLMPGDDRMVVLDPMSRFHLAIEALRRCQRLPRRRAEHILARGQALTRHRGYVLEHQNWARQR